MDFKTVELTMRDGVNEAMEDRGINEDDVRQVLEYAENEGKKLYIEGENHFLGKKRINNFTVNLEYILGENSVELLNMYSHTVLLAEDQ